MNRSSIGLTWKWTGAVAFLVLVVVALPVRAQTSPSLNNPQGSLQQANGINTTPSDEQSAAVVSQQNSDLGGLKLVNKYPVPDTITISTIQSVFWTDNAFLTPNHTRSSFAYNGSYLAAYVPYSTRDWTPTISFQQQFIRYDNASVLDFDAETAQIGSQYAIFKDKSLTWNSTYSLQRLYTERLHLGEFYKESFFDNGLVYVKSLSSNNQVFFVGSYDIGWRLTDPQQYSRIDNSLLLSVVYQPISEVRLQGYLRPAIYDYTDNEEINPANGALFYRGRTDYNIATGVIASYTPIKYVTFTSNVGWTGNYSNVGDREYRTVTPSFAVTGTFGF